MTSRGFSFFLTIFSLLVSCASAPPPGIRDEYRSSTVSSVSVAPAFSTDSFSVLDSERKVVHRIVEQHAANWLIQAGVTTVRTSAFIEQLGAAGQWESVHDAWFRDVPLSDLFEPTAVAFRGTEIETTRLHAPQIGTQTILFIQVLYQSDVDCTHHALHEYTPYAAPLADTDDERCVITHLEGKLIEARTGLTIWQNRVLIERGDSWTASTRYNTLETAVDWLLGSSTGIIPLLKGESAPLAEASAMNPIPEN